MRNLICPLSLIILLSSCGGSKNEPDAWGNFESKEIMISSLVNGKIQSMPVNQGDVIKAGDLVAITDTAIFKLQITELEAKRSSVRTRLQSIDAENDIIDQQISNLETDIERVKSMLLDKAATEKQLDDLKGRLKVLEKQKEANRTRKMTVRSELNAFDAGEALLQEQLDRCYVKSPAGGTILEKYSEAGEITAAARPLVKLADLENMILKVYISGARLAEVKAGQQCKIRIDSGEKGYTEYAGRVIHIAGEAEFTPKIIQTKEERVHLVYAVKILVKNDGSLKNGMPAEAFFSSSN